MDPIKIARINELSKLKKERELSFDEQKEQNELRKEFLDNFRDGFEQQLKNVKVVKIDDKK